MALVEYPESESDEEDRTDVISSEPSAGSASHAALKRKHSGSDAYDLPPLPAAFHDLYSTNARVSTSDNPSLHGGRKRATPHVEGIPSQTESDDLHGLIRQVRGRLELQAKSRLTKISLPNIVPSLQSELGAPLPLHISLSRTLQIRTDDRDDFLETLKTCVRRSAVSSFHFKFSSLKWVPNFERNRWFLVLGIEKPGHNELNRLLGACNEASKQCGHPGLYVGGQGDGPMENNTTVSSVQLEEDGHDAAEAIDLSDRFHVSIAWTLEEPDPEHISSIRALPVTEYLQPPLVSFDTVKVRIGNVVHNIDLRKPARLSGMGRKPELDAT